MMSAERRQVGLVLFFQEGETGGQSAFVVDGVQQGGPVGQAGGARVERGDQVVAVGQKSVVGKTPEELVALIATEGRGARLQLTLIKLPRAALPASEAESVLEAGEA